MQCRTHTSLRAQVYYGIGWKKKYKAPSDFCFAIKHPQIQVKAPKHTRYLCADDARTLHQWMMAIRVAKVRLGDRARGREGTTRVSGSRRGWGGVEQEP